EAVDVAGELGVARVVDAEAARLEEGVLLDVSPDRVLELVVAVERKRERRRRVPVEPGEGIRPSLEDEDVLASVVARQDVCRRASSRAAADDADVEVAKRAVSEQVV